MNKIVNLLSGFCLIAVIATSCEKDTLPTISTTMATNIGAETAMSGGTITNDGGAPVTSRGICWSLNQSPTISDNKTSDGSGIGDFTSSISGLTLGATYFVRAYATNNVGTAYGTKITFTTLTSNGTTVTDIDGNVYNTAIIGNQTWMIKNLKTTKYRNGETIGTTTPVTLDISAQNSPKYQWAYDGSESNVATYGRLYTWYAATDSRNICPIGWHLSTDAEWADLTNYLGGGSFAGGKLKETGTSHWLSPNTEAVNSRDFTALPGGVRNQEGNFADISLSGYWWTSIENNALSAWYRRLYYDGRHVLRNYFTKANGLSVRCVRD